MRKPTGSAALVVVGEATPLHPEPALFESMLEGWRRQHSARRLSPGVIRTRERIVRRFRDYTGAWPWQWRPEHLDAWITQGRWAHSTVRYYEGSLGPEEDGLTTVEALASESLTRAFSGGGGI